ncbi:hypothetical protein [Pararhizobium sp.]|uniref:hypothetical protein n=1 Tax=Pararhizobium sp. TaxID=1977563 RepID=UPI002716BEE3|nr:hypothetical protein [Pararhizobium sp.]MDO9417021.1 hypothetical protein [Pararhizobium sp.]
MACGSCEKRRKMLADARKQGVKGVVKALPTVARDILRNPPRFTREEKRNG